MCLREERGMRRVRGVESCGRGAWVLEPAGIVDGVNVGLVDRMGGRRAIVSREAVGWRLDAGF